MLAGFLFGISCNDFSHLFPAPSASTAGTCLYVVNIGSAPMPKIPRYLHLVNCFQFDGPMGQCSADFRQFHIEVVGSMKRGRKVWDRQEE